MEGRNGEMNWRDGSKKWTGGMVRGMDRKKGWRDGQKKGWRDVVLLYLFYFREKRNFRIFVKNPFSRKAKVTHFREPFSRKTKMIFVRIFVKIYFRPTLGILLTHIPYLPVCEGRVHGDGGTEDGASRLQGVTLRDLHQEPGHNLCTSIPYVPVLDWQ